VGEPEGIIGRNRHIYGGIILKIDLPEVGCWGWMD
jgi:hypothetical protein